MHDTGSYTLAQDEASCIVYGMPREAVKHGGVDRVLPLDALAAAILRGPGGGYRLLCADWWGYLEFFLAPEVHFDL